MQVLTYTFPYGKLFSFPKWKLVSALKKKINIFKSPRSETKI